MICLYIFYASKSQKQFMVSSILPKKRTKVTILKIIFTQESKFRSVFGRIEETINWFWYLLTFSLDKNPVLELSRTYTVHCYCSVWSRHHFWCILNQVLRDYFKYALFSNVTKTAETNIKLSISVYFIEFSINA